MSEQTQTVRVVMHAHSEWSYDADWPLERIAAVMPRFGARVVMMCEHDTGFPADKFNAFRDACATASTDTCLLIPGIEYSDPDNAVHMPTWGLSRFLGEGRPVLQNLEEIAANDGAAIFAHPARRDVWSIFDPQWTPLLTGLEIWNRKTDGIAPGREAVRLLQETNLQPVVGMDFHRRNHLWPLTNKMEVRGDISEASVVDALRAGRVTPCAFGRPLVDKHGAIRQAGHIQAESLRRFLRHHVLRRR